MGIERFFSSIENNNYIYEFNKKIIAEYLYIDFNSIVYITHKDVLNDINYILLRNIKKEYNDKKVELLCEKYKIKIDCSLDNFLKQINDNFLIKYIVDKTEDYILDKIIGSYIVPDKLKYFYIAFSYTSIYDRFPT